MNAIEKAAIAKGVADYIIDHLLVDEPMSASELASLAIDITEFTSTVSSWAFVSVTALPLQPNV